MHRTHRQSLVRCLVMLVVCGATATAAHAVIQASVAGDVCGPTVDPCVITEVVQLADNSILDFGTRTVRVQGLGQLDFGSSLATLRCGRLEIDVGTSTGVKARGSGGSTSGGVAVFQVRRRCSGNLSIVCLSDSVCTQNDAGLCSSGDGAVFLNGRVNGNAENPGAIFVTAVGPIHVQRPIAVIGSRQDSDGGLVELESLGSSVTVSADIDASSGSLGGGGDIAIYAATDVLVTGILDASGGDFDGGSVDVLAGGDLELAGKTSAAATAGEGSGGDISLDAGGDVRLTGGAAGARMVLDISGAGPFEGFGGDGGQLSIDAGGDIEVGPFVRADVAGGRPDGSADSIDLLADGSIVVAGELKALGRGVDGSGGEVTLAAAEHVSLLTGSVLDVSGSRGGAGSVDVVAGVSLHAEGAILADAGNGGLAGEVRLVSRDRLELRGVVGMQGAGGSSSGQLGITACRVSVAAGASITNSVAFASQVFTGRETVVVAAGAQVVASGPDATNTVVFRTETKPPLIQGRVSPSPDLVLDRALVPCPICGDANLEDGETCDDGNTVNGDGCSQECQDEGCVAETPGYPLAPLCNDDDACTRDDCDGVAHACVHALVCGVTTTTLSSGFCGDGVVDADEDCDTGSANGRSGNACAAGCIFRACGDPNGSGSVTASDAFFILQVAVGTFVCDDCLCDVQQLPGARSVTASDALTTLRRSVGLPVSFSCPVCN